MELKDGYYDGMIVSVTPIKSRFGQDAAHLAPIDKDIVDPLDAWLA